MYYVSETSALPPPFNLVPIDKAAAGLHWLARRYPWIRKVSFPSRDIEQLCQKLVLNQPLV